MPVVLAELSQFSDDQGNNIAVADAVRFHKSHLTFSEHNAQVIIGRDANIHNMRIVMARDSVLEIGAGCVLSGYISVGADSRVSVGDGTTVTGQAKIRAVEATSITIGRDCMFASNNVVRTNDGHPIYDARTRERINRSASIAIEDHVWLADDAVVLKGVTIGRASVVAMRSLVTRSIPANVICAGSPAKVIRENIVWERKIGDHSPEFYHSLADA